MNNIIEKYVYDVVRRLPEKMRSEVTKELRSNIEEMLSDKPNTNEIIDVLQSLGHPRILASKYRGKDRYLIGPEYYEDYLAVLKVILIVFVSVSVVFGAISSILNLDATTVFRIIAEVLGEAFENAISALFTGFALVTIVFAIKDKFNNNEKALEFDVLTLPELPDIKVKEISVVCTTISLIVNVIFGFLFIYLIYTNNLNVIWFIGNGSVNSLAIFTESVINPLIPLLIVSVIANVSLDAFKLVKRRWNLSVIGVHTFVKILTATIAIIVLRKSGLINAELITQFSSIFD